MNGQENRPVGIAALGVLENNTQRVNDVLCDDNGLNTQQLNYHAMEMSFEGFGGPKQHTQKEDIEDDTKACQNQLEEYINQILDEGGPFTLVIEKYLAKKIGTDF